MSSISRSDHLSTLLATVDEAFQANNLHRASEVLREASNLDPQNAQVQERWTTLRSRDSQSSIVEALRTYLKSNQNEEGHRLLASLKQKPVDVAEAVQATELLLYARTDAELTGSLLGALLSRSVESRKSIANKLAANATETFELVFKHGDEAFNAFTLVPLESDLWVSKDKQINAQTDVFRLCVAKLIEPGGEHLERAMKCISRLLSSTADNVSPIVDYDIFDSILSSLDIRLQAPLRSQAVLAASKLLEATKERGEELFRSFILSRVDKQTNDDLVIAFSAAAAVFPIIPTVAARLFMTDGFVQQLVPNLERNSEDAAAGKRKSQSLETAALELLSVACVDKSCREAVKRYCSDWLKNLTQERKGTHKAIAAVVLAKISADATEDVTAKLEQLVLSGDAETEQAIEGLAYVSLQASVKEEIASNNNLLKRLVTSLKDRPATSFGCLNVFANLTTYRPALSEEQKKMSQLKAYANSSKTEPEEPLDDDAHVSARCNKLLDSDVVPALAACCKQNTSPTNVELVVRIFLALAKEQKHRAKMAQQGVVKLLLQIKERMAGTNKSTTDASTIERKAAHALARLLISINPTLMFSSALPASSAVAALVPLLTYDQDSEQRNLLPTFEALLALTNLASMEDNSIRELQLRLAWQQLEDHLLLSSNTLVQRASVELVCNLMASPTCVAKFVGDGSKREATRTQILLALADVEDLATRRAAGGALAMLTEWDAAVSAILDSKASSGPQGVKILLRMCADDSDEIKHRGLVCIANVLNAPGGAGQKGMEIVKEHGGVEVIQSALKKTNNREILSIGVEALKRLM